VSDQTTLGLQEKETKKIYDFLSRVEMNEEVPYLEIAAVVGKLEFDAQVRSWTDQARWKLIRDSSVVFDPVRGRSLRRLNDEDIAALGPTGLRRLRRAAKKISTKISSADYEKLTTEGRVKHNLFLSLFGALIQGTTRQKVKRLEAEVERVQTQLSIGSTLDLFK
jgi:hypothetical protein